MPLFSSFFPRPKLLFPFAVLWIGLATVFWFTIGRDLGVSLSVGNLLGYGYPPELVNGADAAQQELHKAAADAAGRIWLAQYMIAIGAIFCVVWAQLFPHRWFWWSVVVSGIIVFFTWFQVQLDVMINNWFGTFYNLVQKALGTPGSIDAASFYGQLTTFASIAFIYIAMAVLNHFVVSHYIFRWRTAMNDYYVANWQRLRHIEGASQRIQEDTMRFASTMESLGISFINSVMTLAAFLPILWALSVHVKALPILGAVPQGLVIVAVIWAVFGTTLLALAGIRLPGLEFRNQRFEAAYRKELVFGEDYKDRAQPPTLAELFHALRQNYFKLYLNYLYFNVFRYGYLQASVLVPYVALGPSIIAGGLTLGAMQQIVRAFGRVETSFQYLVNSWPTIVELISIYKRLRAFEATLNDEPLPDIEKEAEAHPAPV
jgi:peptide/bleomycin uptake transporter